MQESNALSPVPTTLIDFERTHLLEGETLASACEPSEQEVKGYLKNLELSGFVRAARAFERADVELVPLLSAWAISGGPLSRETYETLAERLLERLKAAGRVDAVFLALHGAMGVQGLRDPETDLIRRVKAVTHGRPVAASFDLHGNLSKERVAACDVISGYHTNPHRDHARTAARATRTLLRALVGDVHIETAWRSLPMILGGGTTLDFIGAMRPIYARVKSLHRTPGVLDASVFPVHPWNDDPELGWGCLVHTDGDRALAEQIAEELAERCWAVRDIQPPKFASATDAIRDARGARLRRRLGTVVLADVSDVVTAGSIGESTELLAALVTDAPDLLSYVPVRDAEVVEQAHARTVGESFEVRVGGKLDPARTQPFATRVTLRSKHAAGPFGRVVVLDAGKTRLCVTEGAPMVMMPTFFSELGLDPWKADVVVVKNFFPFRTFFLPQSRKTIYVQTHGITDLDAAFALTFNGPVHPRDPVADWRAEDRRRRAV